MAAIHDALSALHGDEKYADLTVTCGEHTFKLHRAVICPQSPFFEKACSGGFMEASTGHINLSEEDPEIFKKFIQFIYTGNYEDEDHLSPEGCDEAVLQPVDEILSSLRHGTDIPGFDHYRMDLWNETGRHRDFPQLHQDTRACRGCDACLCSFCDPDETGMCPYDNDRNYNYGGYVCNESGAEMYSETGSEYYHSSDEDEDADDDEMDGDFPLAGLQKWPIPHQSPAKSLNELIYPNDDDYVTSLPHAMFTSVSVYAMADMFSVPALKIVARNRFYKAVERQFDSPDFPDVVDEVFRTTAPDVWTLKEICVLFIRTRFIGKHCDAELWAALEQVFGRHEDLVQRMAFLPELEDHYYFKDGWLYKRKAEDGQEGVEGNGESAGESGDGSPGSSALSDKIIGSDQEED